MDSIPKSKDSLLVITENCGHISEENKASILAKYGSDTSVYLLASWWSEFLAGDHIHYTTFLKEQLVKKNISEILFIGEDNAFGFRKKLKITETDLGPKILPALQWVLTKAKETGNQANVVQTLYKTQASCLIRYYPTMINFDFDPYDDENTDFEISATTTSRHAVCSKQNEFSKDLARYVKQLNYLGRKPFKIEDFTFVPTPDKEGSDGDIDKQSKPEKQLIKMKRPGVKLEKVMMFDVETSEERVVTKWVTKNEKGEIIEERFVGNTETFIKENDDVELGIKMHKAYEAAFSRPESVASPEILDYAMADVVNTSGVYDLIHIPNRNFGRGLLLRNDVSQIEIKPRPKKKVNMSLLLKR